MTKKLFIQTYGCQMNVYDSNRMEDLLKPFGYEASDSAEDADMVILNTCHIREKAAEKVYSELGRIRSYKLAKQQNKQKMIVAVAGCVGQAEGEEIFRRAPYVDIVVGPGSYHNLPELITKIMRDDKHLINLDFSFDKKFDLLPGEHSPQGYSAFLSIQEGCDKFCSFCVVPYTRGAEFSRGFSEIYREALQYSSSGTVELTLLGQNVNAYHGLGADGQNCNLSYLIEQLSNIEQIKRLRYTTSHPRDMTPDLIEAHGNFPKLMPCLHLPVQSGSDKVLKEMNRKHTVEEYLAIIAGLRESRPDITFTSDFIVGFPGESEQDFQDTLDLIREVNFTQAFSFKYSPRPGTPASVKKNQIDVDVQDERLARLQALVTGQQMKFNQGFVGQYVEVLFERAGKFAGQVIGKTPYMQSVYIENGKDYLGQILPVRITGYKQNSLIGEVA